MGAPRGSVEFEYAEELHRLRRRAYGPDADIAEDAAAQARLSELEAAHRQPTLVGDAGPAVSASMPEGAPVPDIIDGSLPWRRRRRSVIVGGVIAVLTVNIAVTASVWQLLADRSTPIPAASATEETPRVPSGRGGGYYVPAPDHVLALTSAGAAADQPKDPGGRLDALGIRPGELKRYEDFQGPDVWNINVWSGESRYGMTCLLIAVAGQPISDGGRAAEGCSLQGQATIADIMGTDTLTRLVLKGDHVDVYVYEGGADPNAS